MTKEEFNQYLLDGKEVYLPLEKLTYYMYNNNIYVFKETKHGHGITLGMLDETQELKYEEMQVKNSNDVDNQ